MTGSVGRSLTALLRVGCNLQKVGARQFCSSSARSNSYLNVNKKNGIAVIVMNKEPVNSMSLEFMNELNTVLPNIEKDHDVQGIILTSAQDVFSAGLDIHEMYNPEINRLRTFWKSFQNLALNLHTSSKATIAAINGSAPAAGCAMALCCDYRIMAEGKYHIGLPAALLGIVAPTWLQEMTAGVVGHRQADMLLQRALLLSSKKALEVGMVDQLAPQNQVVDVAITEMNQWLSVPGRQLTKRLNRQRFAESLEQRKKEDQDFFVQLVQLKSTQSTIEKYLSNLKQR